MSLKFEDFSPEQRNVIGEFVYSWENEVLIKSDAKELVQLFLSKKLIEKEHAEELHQKIDNNKEVVEEIIEILFISIEEIEGKKIMTEYFSNPFS
jgi:hypothetical protein